MAGHVTLGAPHEAGAAIAAENQFNDPRDAGTEYWIVPVTATYTGDKTGNAGFDIAVKFVGSDNRTYDDSCGVIPDPMNDVGALYKGGAAQGNGAWPSQRVLKDCGLSPRVSATPSSFAAKQPVRKPPWLTAHFSNLADLMERRGPHPPLPVQLRGLSCPAAIFAHDSYIMSTERDMLCPTVEYSTG